MMASIKHFIQGGFFPLVYLLFVFAFPLSTDAISNYDKQGISQNYTEGLPEFAVVNGLESNLGDIPSRITLNRTQVYLNCTSDYMNITLTFREKFYGIVYADYDKTNNDYDRTCRINGEGQLKRELNLSLKGCGTVQSPARVFINNIVVRFHPGLEMDGDEVITVICRYPEPIVINPPAIPEPLVVLPGTPIQALQPLRDFEVLLIICAIIFLALLLLGFGCSYYCLKKRNIKVVRKRPASTLGSEITKASDPISMFSGLKIPRAHAVESSGSEQLTESIHTEYNSEEGSGTSEEEYHSTYSDQACEISEGVIFSQVKEPTMPEFDVKAIIKRSERPRSPESSRMSSDSELILKAQEQYLTTILERTETNTKETLERVRRLEAKKGPPPVHARIRVHNKQLSDTSEMESESEFSQVPSEYYEDDMCLESRDTTNALMEQKNEFDVNIKTRPKEIHYTTDEDSSVMFSDTESIKPYRPDNQTIVHSPPTVKIHPPPSTKIHPPGGIVTHHQTVTDYSVRPKQTVTDYSVRPKQTVTDYSVRPKQTVTDYSVRPKQPQPGRPDQPSDTTYQTRPIKYTTDRQQQLPRTPTTHHTSTYTLREQNQTHIENIVTRQPDEMSQITTSGLSITDVHGRERFDVFIRVLDPPEYTDTRDEISSIFTEDERIRIKEVILQDVKVQKLIETATTTDDFIHIKNQKSLQNIVEPQKWEVLIRVLQNPIIFDDPFERESSRSTKTGASNQELRSLSEVMVDLDRRSIPGSSHINTPTVIYEETHHHHPPSSSSAIPIPGRRDMPEGAHYVITESSPSRPGVTGTTTHEVHYYSSSPTRTSQTVTREFISGGSSHVVYPYSTSAGSIEPRPTTHSREEMLSSSIPADILAPIIHRVDEETGSTIRRVIQSVSQREGFDVQFGFPDDNKEGKDLQK